MSQYEIIIKVVLWSAALPVSGLLIAMGIDFWADNVAYLISRYRFMRADYVPKRKQSE
jgi:hypothetical protein